ncbi:hypothetical protein HOT75_gp050 [Gordonia phage Daredevil]|uniref:Uncharacterized protein n=1 Tax=Gordonia phage Daredevil TaxID=2283286 RepID=A0A345MIQ6_9CAUD|nr:hypothetical protein HOT75_gp050 [Gordonia phage Daredevil]AXH70437.1 hypothetical protein SEA_DAREDEVIL_50 [Gordonia phage Daredevil]
MTSDKERRPHQPVVATWENPCFPPADRPVEIPYIYRAPDTGWLDDQIAELRRLMPDRGALADAVRAAKEAWARAGGFTSF